MTNLKHIRNTSKLTILGRWTRDLVREKKPVFPHSMWLKHDMVMETSDTTTNRSEGFNNQLKARTPKNASIWTLIEQLKQEDKLRGKLVRRLANYFFHWDMIP